MTEREMAHIVVRLMLVVSELRAAMATSSNVLVGGTEPAVLVRRAGLQEAADTVGSIAEQLLDVIPEDLITVIKDEEKEEANQTQEPPEGGA